mgnify:CR=1 FL=1
MRDSDVDTEHMTGQVWFSAAYSLTAAHTPMYYRERKQDWFAPRGGGPTGGASEHTESEVETSHAASEKPFPTTMMKSHDRAADRSGRKKLPLCTVQYLQEGVRDGCY